MFAGWELSEVEFKSSYVQQAKLRRKEFHRCTFWDFAMIGYDLGSLHFDDCDMRMLTFSRCAVSYLSITGGSCAKFEGEAKKISFTQ
jgi:hypothetical protein